MRCTNETAIERSPTTDATRFTFLLSPHSQSWDKINLRNTIVDREVAEGMLRLREQHGLPRLALYSNQALDTYWGNPSTTHTLLAD